MGKRQPHNLISWDYQQRNQENCAGLAQDLIETKWVNMSALLKSLKPPESTFNQFVFMLPQIKVFGLKFKSMNNLEHFAGGKIIQCFSV